MVLRLDVKTYIEPCCAVFRSENLSRKSPAGLSPVSRVPHWLLKNCGFFH
ncbi:hypothetical protein AB434_0031 [Heyndrickxia coagulans]|uniref:Uncharacterized protein n=1 Tax=Heyndrickxia coagulans TaxID=1398 RepID=A0A0C5C964_HEYCO|nr:hypothetical protein SB48_HM08orf01776 [Heyndrickxia coagulans]AKN52436.1 hypothetical protein AB434_0031 [Heyndrickxia coagulans]KWZ78267.1 hypothetical protein HMPREF3213_03055 [Heyndrickxia coagulans]